MNDKVSLAAPSHRSRRSLDYIAFLMIVGFALHVGSARAAISIVSYWRMGDNDPGAVVGATATNTLDSIGTRNLAISTNALYASDVSTAAQNQLGSSRSIRFNATNSYALTNIVTTNVDNFGLELWVKLTSTNNNRTIAYNGNTATSGWGLVMNGANYGALFGGQVAFGSAPAPTNVWTHLALVRNSGVATLYVNGAVAIATNVSPNLPVGNFAVGTIPQAPANLSLVGLVDEVRVFTFAAGQFATNDLLLNTSYSYAVGTTNLLEGPSAGSDSVVLAANSVIGWTNSANAPWLHLATPSGFGSTNVIFSFDVNPGVMRSGTLTLAGFPVTVTQAGSNYVRVPATGIPLVSGMFPGGVAVDGAYNVYVTDYGSNSVRKFTRASGTVATLFNTGVSNPRDVDVDGAGNLYIAYAASNSIVKWNAANASLSNLITGLNFAAGVALDRATNVFVADTFNNQIIKRTAATGVLTTNVTGLNNPYSVTVDVAGNLYIADTLNNFIRKFSAAGVLTTVASGTYPQGVKVDGSGNVYFSTGDHDLRKWSAVSGAVSILQTNLSSPLGVSVDSAGNIYVCDTGHGQLKELPYVFVDPSPIFMGLAGGTGSLSPVVPANAHLTGTLAPTSDQPWLTITGVANGIVSYAVAPNTGPGPRTGNIMVLGQSILVSQPSPTYSIATSSLLVESKAGSNSVILATSPAGAIWTATTNAPWLHLSAANQNGAGSGNVVFSFDANPTGSSRSGTLTIAGQTLTVTQVASNLVAASNASVVLAQATYATSAVAVDDAGNVYFGDAGDPYADIPIPATVSRWNANDHSVTLLVTNGVDSPQGLAVDHEGNVYIADTSANAVKKWTATNGAVTVLAGFNGPYDVATDDAGNVYVAEAGANAVKKWTAADGSISNVIVGLGTPRSVDVDHAGNVYMAENSNNSVRKWNAESGTVTTVMSGVNPRGVAVDNSGNVYMTDATGQIKKWIAATGATVTLPLSFFQPYLAIAVDRSQNVYAIDYTLPVKAVLAGFADPTPKSENLTGGSDVLAAVAPPTSTLLSLMPPYSDQSWLTINSFSNGVTGFSFTSAATNRTGNIGLLGINIPVTQGGPSYFLGLSSLLVGPAAGSDSVMLQVIPYDSAWTASANAAWLHIAATNQSGVGGTNVIFSYDTNTGSTRTSTLTIAGQTVTVTQAGSTYLPTTAAPAIIPPPAFGGVFRSVGVDAAGNVYGGYYNTTGISKWNPATGTVTTLGSMRCYTLGVNLAGDIALLNYSSNTVDRWSAANVQTPLLSPAPNPGTASIDGLGNVYLSVGAGILKWTAANSNVTTLASGFSNTRKVFAAGAGNVYDVYFCDYQIVRKWSAASGLISTQVNGGVDGIGGTVDGSGNIYIAQSSGLLRKWSAVTRTVTTLSVPGLSSYLQDVAVDPSGHTYISDAGNSAIKMLPRAFVDVTPRPQGLAPGTGTLPPVLPLNLYLTGPLFPTSNVPWLTVTGVTNGVVSYSFTTNDTGSTRTGNINVLGRQVSVMQFGSSFALGTTSLLEGPAAGSDSVVLAVAPESGNWTTTANDPWLHISPGMSGGVGSTNVVFTFDTNPGATRTGTLTVGDHFVTVTQAGSTYIAAGSVTPVASNLSSPRGVAVDPVGNLYVADLSSNTIKKWTRANNTVTTLVATGLNNPHGVAVDGAGNLYIADFGNHAIKKWTAVGGNVTSLVSTGLSFPEGVAVDGAGNVYIADTYNYAIKKWIAASSNVTTLVSSGLNLPKSVAVDVAGNVYIADSANDAIKKWTAANSNVTTLVSSGLNHPEGVAVDGSGNVHIADSYHSAVKTWKAASGTVVVSMSAGLSLPEAVAVDRAGHLYAADSYDDIILELPRAYLDPTPMFEGASTGFDALPVVLPTSVNLAPPLLPASDQSWLLITAVNGGVVNFSFAANFGPTRTAHINLLGLSVPVVQRFYVVPPTLTDWKNLGNGTFQFTFTNSQGVPFTVLSTTNLSLPASQWTVAGAPLNITPGVFQFTTPPTSNDSQRYYRIRSP